MIDPSPPPPAVDSPGLNRSPGREAVSASEASSRWRLVMRRLLQRRRAMFGLLAVVLLFALAYLTPYVMTWQYNQLDTDAFLSPPTRVHWFGTTQNGFDMF